MSQRRRFALLGGLAALSFLLGWLETRPPAWLREDPLTHPLGLDILRHVAIEGDSPGEDPRRARREPVPTNVNAAGEKALQRLPGVGPVTAGRILALRDSLGDFADPEALLAVKGIGPVTLEKMRPFLRFAADSTAADSAGATPAGGP